jgi:Uma2 family endonuclease
MTALPAGGQLLTSADFAALPEDDQHRWELVEGSLVMSPTPTPQHMVALGGLYAALAAQLPPELRVPDVDLDLVLAAERSPGTVRRPDLVVVTKAEYQRVTAHGGLLRASDTMLVVEVISPGSRRTDDIFKRDDYADAGIPHYWIVDVDDPVSLTACRRVDEFGYQDAGEVTGVLEVTEPFAARIDLDSLG